MSMQPQGLPPLDPTNDLLAQTPVRVRWAQGEITTTEGRKQVFIISFFGPHGSFTQMFDIPEAEALAQQLGDAIRQAKSGIIVAPRNVDLGALQRQTMGLR